MVWVEKHPEMAGHVGLDSNSPFEVYKTFNKMLMDANSAVFAVDAGGGLLGYLAVTSVMPDGSAHVHAGVDPDRRGRGGLMMKRGLRFAFEQLGLKRLVAVVPPGRDEIERLDKALGFVEPEGKVLFLDRERWANGRG